MLRTLPTRGETYTCRSPTADVQSLASSGVRTTRDPIALLKKWLLEHQLCSDAEVKAIEKRMRAEVDAAVAFAKDAPQPPANELTADIYSGMKVDPRMCNL